jgi:hypothetical protein
MAHVVSMAVRVVQQEGRALQCLDATLRADQSVVYAAVANDGRALDFVTVVCSVTDTRKCNAQRCNGQFL